MVENKRRCASCKKLKGIAMFTKNTYSCKPCRSEYVMRQQRANPIYCAFRRARHSCNNINDTSYKLYGGRGIKFKIKKWQDIAEAIGPRPDGHILNRIDINKDYTVDNIRWATKIEMGSNTRRFALTAEMVEYILKMRRHGLLPSAISMKVGLSADVIRKLIWKINMNKRISKELPNYQSMCP